MNIDKFKLAKDIEEKLYATKCNLEKFNYLRTQFSEHKDVKVEINGVFYTTLLNRMDMDAIYKIIENSIERNILENQHHKDLLESDFDKL